VLRRFAWGIADIFTGTMIRIADICMGTMIGVADICMGTMIGVAEMISMGTMMMSGSLKSVKPSRISIDLKKNNFVINFRHKNPLDDSFRDKDRLERVVIIVELHKMSRSMKLALDWSPNTNHSVKTIPTKQISK
jgi:hypothetical protein